jgi:hypothetical protein
VGERYPVERKRKRGSIIQSTAWDLICTQTNTYLLAVGGEERREENLCIFRNCTITTPPFLSCD